MKKIDTYKVMSSKAKAIFFSILFITGLSSFNSDDKITICHIPPGNPSNCQEISISKNALQSHLNHGDRLVCYYESELPLYLELVDYNHSRIIKKYESH